MSTKIFEKGSLFANYMVIVTLMGLVLFQSKDSKRKLVIIALILAPIIFIVSLLSGQEIVLYLMFVSIVLGYTMYQLFFKFEDMDKNFKSILGFYTLGTFVFTFMDQLNYVTQDQYNPMRLMGSAVMFLLLVVHFMQRYDGIQNQKDYFYERLRKDHLTGAYSKSYFLTELKEIELGTVMFIDINKFKWINDTLGHGIADQVLKDFSGELMSIESEYIIPARYGGDEFAIVFKNYSITSTLRQSVEIIEAFKGVLKAHIRECPQDIGISIGISNIQVGKIEATIGYADRLMYIAKSEGNYRVITQEMIEEVTFE